MPRPRPAKKKSSSAFVWLLMILVIAGAGAVMFVGQGGLEDGPSPQLLQRIEFAKDALDESGVSIHATGRNAVDLVLPAGFALETTERQAMELALTARQHLGDKVTVRVKTPAGQTIATARP
jgi:hypothetical protein